MYWKTPCLGESKDKHWRLCSYTLMLYMLFSFHPVCWMNPVAIGWWMMLIIYNYSMNYPRDGRRVISLTLLWTHRFRQHTKTTQKSHVRPSQTSGRSHDLTVEPHFRCNSGAPSVWWFSRFGLVWFWLLCLI